MNHLYDTSTRKRISSGSAPITNIASGRAVVSLPDGDESGIWNEHPDDNFIGFDPRTPETREASEIFWARFLETEQENLVQAANAGNAKALALMKAMEFPVIDRADQRIINRVVAMEAAGKLDSVGRAAVILNG